MGTSRNYDQGRKSAAVDDLSDDAAVLNKQLAFFKQKRAGCLFAAAAARNPAKYGWVHRFPELEEGAIDATINAAIGDPVVTTLSMLFPEIITAEALAGFIRTLERCRMLILEQKDVFNGSVCFGFRARVGDLRSYVTGFGDFPFLPKTRRAPSVEIVMRVKPRPKYDFVFKEAPADVIHLADLDMRGMRRERLWGLWNGSFEQTEEILGAKPDLRSAAKTTYSIPEDLATSLL